MQLNHNLGTSLELRIPHHDRPLWRYVYSGKPKPFFHPITTLAGYELTLFEPSDHIWHRGLWFTIKFLNGENFWEDRPDTVGEFGTQHTLTPPDVTHGPGGEITVSSRQEWRRPKNAGVIFTEQRTFWHRPIDDESYALDFEFQLNAQADVLLDRSPFTTWGGYGGLVFRANRNWTKTKLLFDDGTTSDRPTPKHSKWCQLSGPIDGGLDKIAGVAMFDHPSNPRHPVGWYGGTGIGHYFNAAFLFEEPMQMKAAETLTLKYRVLIHDGPRTVDQLNAAFAAWVK